MDNEKIYGKEEIRKILAKASEIQTRKELYGDDIGLNEKELVQLAHEIGVDTDSLTEALRTYQDPSFNDKFSWLRPNTRIQHVENLPIKISENNWDDVIQEIRKETGGIGKTTYTGRSIEWEQRRNDIGYKHISFTPNDTGTNVQMVSSWSGLKIITYMFSAMFPFVISLILFKGIGKDTAIMIGTTAAILAQIPARIYLKNYFEKQKTQFRSIIDRISRRVNSIKSTATSGLISIDEKSESDGESEPLNKKEGMRN